MREFTLLMDKRRKKRGRERWGKREREREKKNDHQGNLEMKKQKKKIHVLAAYSKIEITTLTIRYKFTSWCYFSYFENHNSCIFAQEKTDDTRWSINTLLHTSTRRLRKCVNFSLFHIFLFKNNLFSSNNIFLNCITCKENYL